MINKYSTFSFFIPASHIYILSVLDLLLHLALVWILKVHHGPVRFKGHLSPLIVIFLNQTVAKTLGEIIDLTTGRSGLLIME